MNSKIAAYCLGSLALVAAVGWNFLAKDSVVATAERAQDAIARSNGPQLFSLMEESEKDAYHLDASRMQQFLDTAITPVLKFSGTSASCEQISISEAACSMKPTCSGSPVPIYLNVVKTEKGFRVVGVIRTLVSAVLLEDYLKGTKRDSESKRRSLLAASERYRTKFENLGINGFFNPSEGRVVDWSEWIGSLQASLSR